MAVDLALAKLHLRVTADSENTLIERYIAAAAASIEQQIGSLLTRREVKQQFSTFATRLPLYWGPDPADVSLAYIDEAGDDQTLEELQVLDGWFYAPSSGWPSVISNSVIEATYTAGFESVPADVETAQLLLIQIAYERRSATADEERAIDCHLAPHRRVPI